MHGERAALHNIHQQIARDLRAGDHVIYLGNILGVGTDPLGAVDSLLAFRRWLMAEGTPQEAIIVLRGAQEEMLRKALQVNYAADPAGVLRWMLDHGLGPTLRAYGSDPAEAERRARDGAVALAGWTAALSRQIADHDGHQQLFSALRHAAVTADRTAVLVSAGIAPDRPLAAQGDAYWWNWRGFAREDEPFDGIPMRIRGVDPDGGGPRFGRATVTLDGGAGRGGTVMAALLGDTGRPAEVIEG